MILQWNRRRLLQCLSAASLLLLAGRRSLRARTSKTHDDLFSKSNLVAWCIVPFDSRKRGPVARAEMLNQLGITKLAYDWREEHIPTFDAEIDALHAHGIGLTAFWLSTGDDPANNHDVQAVLDVLRRRRVKTQIWARYVPDKSFDTLTQEEKVARAAKTISYLAAEAGKIGCSIGLYNHNDWYGEPENELAILHAVHASNVGLVYNFNHAEDQIEQFPVFFPKILPHLMAVNLAGLRQGDKHIFPVGQGGSEGKMIEIVRKSGYRGPIGIINENTAPDAEQGLEMNMAGLRQILLTLGDTDALASYQ